MSRDRYSRRLREESTMARSMQWTIYKGIFEKTGVAAIVRG